MLLKARSKIEELRKERAILKSKIKKLMERIEEVKKLYPRPPPRAAPEKRPRGRPPRKRKGRKGR